MRQEYLIVVKKEYDKQLLLNLARVKDELPNRPKIFIAECTEEELQFLSERKPFKEARLMSSSNQVPLATKTVKTFRRTNLSNKNYWDTVSTFTGTASGYSSPKYGNWGLIRHSSLTNNVTFESEVNHTHTYNYDGTGVDVVLHIGDRLNPNDPEFKTGGVSRIQQFQWNTLDGFSSLPTIDYTNFSTSHGASSRQQHAEAVAYIACGNTYGWATGAHIYTIYNEGTYKVEPPNVYDVVKKFHQDKIAAGNTRPTIMIDAVEESDMALGFYPEVVGGGKFLIFRGTKYETVSPDGIGDKLLHLGNRENRSLGVLPVGSAGSGKYLNVHTDLGSSPTAAQMITYVNDLSNIAGGYYESHVESKNEMIDAGVHAVSAAGNSGFYSVLPDHPDYNNLYAGMSKDVDGNSYVSEVYCFNRGSINHLTKSIMCGALAADFGSHYGFGNKETLTSFSSRGNRVDAVAAGDNIEMELYSKKISDQNTYTSRVNAGQYNATGTSFASPNIGGMAALVLEKYPTTTPKQLRRYFRDIAVGTDKLYDTGLEMVNSSKYGDSPWFSAGHSSMGYSGNIAYLDPSLTYDPTTLADTDPTTSETTQSNQLSFTKDEINTKLAT